MDISKKRILVTGGHGFLGQYVVETLRARGCQNIFIPDHKNYDLTQKTVIKGVFQRFHPEVVIHMAAALGGIGAHIGTQARFLYENLIMGLEVMEQSRIFS